MIDRVAILDRSGHVLMLQQLDERDRRKDLLLSFSFSLFRISFIRKAILCESSWNLVKKLFPGNRVFRISTNRSPRFQKNISSIGWWITFQKKLHTFSHRWNRSSRLYYARLRNVLSKSERIIKESRGFRDRREKARGLKHGPLHK